MINQQQPTTPPDPSYYERCEATLAEVINSLPQLLKRCSDNKAAEIVAGLLKAHMSRAAPATRNEQQSDLDTLINRLKAEEEAEIEAEQALQMRGGGQ